MDDERKEGQWPPKRNEMPDLSSLTQKLILGLTLNTVFRGAGPVDNKAKAFWVNYVRLVDQLVWEYNAARDALQDYIDTPNHTLSHFFRCLAHIETHINTAHRSIKFARRMRRHKDSPRIGKLSVLSDDVGKRIADMRNDIEHLEDEILNGNIEDGQATTLMVQSDRVELFGNIILYSELAEWTKELHSLAEALIDYQESKKT